MALKDIQVKNAKPGDKARKMADGGGLFLLVHPNGSKYWRLKYRFAGKEKLLALGVYPEVGLKQAREGRDDARKLLRAGVDPGEAKKAAKVVQGGADSFEAITREWFDKFSPGWAVSHSVKVIRRFEKDIFPYLGKSTINKIKAPELLAVLRRIEDRGAIETAHRAKQNCGQVFRYAVATGRAERDPTGDLKGALPPPKKSMHAAITDPKKVGGLLRAIDSYTGSQIVCAALQLSALTFVRPGELRQAEWQEFDFEVGKWVIPAKRMKMKAEHIVPLSTQVVTILKDLHVLSGRSNYVFPGARSNNRPLSDNGPRTALRAMGYGNDVMTPHGFRAMASTLLNEQGWRPDVIERQLAHSEQNKVRAAYHRSEYLEERKQMMQAWAD
ncbi:MAG: tyrosine-type recombinase/integrase, partial [Gammaproteobacteria bacterium]|nr:tyrosine-type recombinase/integrase [Gammaproteobacteria bacterium]